MTPTPLSATFTDAIVNAPASDFSATINWGDGSPSPAGLTVTGSGGNYTVTGSHQYAAAGTYNFSITVTAAEGPTVTLPGTATVAKLSSALSAAVNDAGTGAAWSGTEVTGASAYDTAAVNGVSGVTPTGTVTYSLYANATASGTPVSTSTVTLSGGSVPASASTAPLAAGHYSYVAVYSGDGNYTGSTSAVEPFTVTVAASSVSTTVDDAATNSAWSGTEVTGEAAYDTATVNGVSGVAPTGTVTYDFYANATASGTPVSTSTVSLSGGVVPASASTAPLAVGSYSYVAVYSGDRNYLGSTSAVEPFTVTLTAGALTPPVAVEGQPFSNVTVFHFTDADAAATASDYTATINTGDATLTSTANPSNVKIVANGDGFDVQLSYTYAEAIGSGSFSVAVTGAGGVAVHAATTSNFAVTLVRANSSVSQILDVATAQTLLNTPSQQAAVFTGSRSVINYVGAGGDGHFGGDLVFPGESSTSQEVDRFAVEATANITIPAAGNWTFGTTSDDGVRLTVGSLALQRDGVFPPTDTFATFNFPSAGTYPLDLIYYQNAGGTEVEVFAAQGSFTSFNSNFHLVGDTADGGLATDFSVAYPPPTAGTVSASGGVAGVTPTTLSATFSDADVNAPASNFSGTINWGDGNAATPFTSADVTANGNGSFTVNASHQYAGASGATPYNLTVTINDVAGSTTDTGTTTVLAAPTLHNTPSATSVTLDGTGAPTLTDTATLSGGYNETGTITFTLHDPNGNLVDTEYVTTVSGDGSYTTPAGYTLPTNGTVTGTYQWDASYGGDTNNIPASDINDPAGQVTVSPARPTLTTTPSASTITLDNTGAPTLQDSATLNGAYFPTGTVTFYLFAPGVTPAADDSNAVYSETDPLSGGMASTTTGYTLPTNVTVTGTYQWLAAYSGDGNNNSVLPRRQLVNLGSFDNNNTGALSFGSGLLEDSNGNLFGTAANGGAYGVGTVFEVMAGSGVITPLASFDGADGAYPYSNLVENSQGDLFGTTLYGGNIGVGAVFEVVAGSGQITTLGSFLDSNTAAYPVGGLVMDGNGNLFGAASDGTVYEVPYDASSNTYGAITVLASFDGSNGYDPYGNGLVVDSSGNLFGTAVYGGANYAGTVFEVVANSGTITPLASFDYYNTGGYPEAGLVEDSSGNLFGTTTQGGANGYGTVYEVPYDASSNTYGAITPLVSFDGASGAGSYLAGVVVDSSGNLYGVSNNGANGYGEVFEVAAGSGAITPLASFDNSNAGGNPAGGLIEDSSGNLFGTTTSGGADGYGTVFELTQPTRESVTVSAANPTLAVSAGQTAALLGTTTTLTASAVLAGGYSASGTITFTLHDSNGNVVDTETAAVTGNGTYTTPTGYALPSTAPSGAYQWDASYSGDGNNNPASDVTDPNGQVAVLMNTPTNATIVSVIGDLGVQIASLPGGPTSSLGAELETDLINASVAAAQGNVAGVNSALSSFDSTTLTAVTTSGSGVNLTTAATLLTASTDLYYTVNGLPLASAATPQAELADFDRMATNIPGGLTGGDPLVAAFTNIAQEGAVGNFAGLNSALATFDSTVRSELATPGSGVNLTNATAMLEASTNLYYTVNNIPETPTVSVSDAGGTYDGSPFAATATVAGVVAGIDDSPAPSLEGVTPTLTYYLLDAKGNKLSQLGGAPVDAGYYEVDASFAGSTDYTSASASTTFTITPKALTASIIGDPTKVYDGTTTATLTSSNFSLTGLVGSQSFTLTQTAGTYDSKDTDAVTVTASLTASQFTAASGTLASDYTLPTTASGSGTITPAAITYQIGNDNQVFGYPANLAHDLGTTITTGVNGEDLAISYSSTGDIASAPVGSYAITGTLANGTGLLSDYSPTLLNGTLTVTLVPGSAYILNTSAGSALTVTGNAVVNLPGMLVVDSSAANAINASGNAQISAAGGVLVAGGVSTSGNATVSTTGTPTTTSDPLAALPLPSVTGLTNYGAVKVAGNSSTTLSPGIYTSIQVSGNASVTLASGTYILEGGGLSVSGNASLSGSGVLIFNAGSSYNGTTDGGTFGSIALGGNGTINLSGPTTGPYAGVVIFQSRGNSRALSLGGNGAAGITSTVYAPTANVGLSGHATVKGALVVSTLTVTGSAGAFQLAGGASSDYTTSTSNWISNGILTVAAEDDTGNGIDPNEIADVGAAMSYLNSALGSFGVYLSWAAPGSSADVTIHFATTTPEGDASDGVLGFTTASNDVYLVTAGWNFYTGSDPSAIGSGQYDFTTLATHELAHTVGLGESVDPSSVMYEYLAPGTVRRTFTDSNLSLINTNADRFMKAALPAVSGSPGSLNLDSAWSTPMTAQLSSPLAGAAPGLAPGALPALGMDPAGSFGWESALTGSSVFSQVGPVATTPGLDGDGSVLVSGSGNDLVSGGQGWNLMTAVFGLKPVTEDSDEHGALDQLFASGELDLLLPSASLSLDSALVGGPGNDLIIGSGGRNLMLGGFGIDQIAPDRATDSADAPATPGEQGA